MNLALPSTTKSLAYANIKEETGFWSRRALCVESSGVCLLCDEARLEDGVDGKSPVSPKSSWQTTYATSAGLGNDDVDWDYSRAPMPHPPTGAKLYLLQPFTESFYTCMCKVKKCVRDRDSDKNMENIITATSLITILLFSHLLASKSFVFETPWRSCLFLNRIFAHSQLPTPSSIATHNYPWSSMLTVLFVMARAWSVLVPDLRLAGREKRRSSVQAIRNFHNLPSAWKCHHQPHCHQINAADPPTSEVKYTRVLHSLDPESMQHIG